MPNKRFKYSVTKDSLFISSGNINNFNRNNGLQNQSVLYIQKGMNGIPEVLIDPNAWGDTVSLSTFVPSKAAGT